MSRGTILDLCFCICFKAADGIIIRKIRNLARLLAPYPNVKAELFVSSL